jgi:crossover junction endodeoxyribonuclease RusA
MSGPGLFDQSISAFANVERAPPLWTLWLPIPPTVNLYYVNYTRIGKHGEKKGKVYTGRGISDDGKEFSARVYAKVREGHKPAPRIGGRLALEIVVFPDGNRVRFDLDNRVKPLQDALQKAGVFDDDDSQIDDLRIVRGPGQAGGGCVVMLSRFDPDEVQRMMRRAGSRFYNPDAG